MTKFFADMREFLPILLQGVWLTIVVTSGSLILSTLLGMVWARVVGVFLATLGAVASFLTIPFFPVWSIIEVALFVFIIWALISRRRTA